MTMSTSCIRAAAGGLMFLLAAGAVPATGKMTKKVDFGFVNVADTTNGRVYPVRADASHQQCGCGGLQRHRHGLHLGSRV